MKIKLIKIEKIYEKKKWKTNGQLNLSLVLETQAFLQLMCKDICNVIPACKLK